MGFLKKITRPISRVLDKVIPNEIKPALPFLAAAAPFMAPGLMSLGGNTMLSRALISGGLNLGSQLAQEGSDGDFSALSLAMASGIGALSAPNAASTIRGVDPNFIGPRPAAEGILGQGKEYLARGAEFLGPQTGGVTDILGKGGTQAGLNMETLKAASIPLTQGTTDLAIAEARRAQKDYDREMAEYESEQAASDAQRAAAIRQSMEAYGFTDEEIEDAIYAAGYRAGGRVGLKGGGADFGGIPAAIQNIKEDEEETITIMTDNGPMEIQKSVYESMPGMFMDTTTSAYGDAGKGRPVPEFADGGLMNLGGKEMDLRKGGFVPIGKKEKADDVPARLSKNEFVMTADAVRAAGGGSVNKGAKRMYDLMNNLEARV